MPIPGKFSNQIFLLLVISLGLSSCSVYGKESEHHRGVTQDNAIELAKHEIAKAGFKLERFFIEVDKDNSMWNFHMSILKQSDSTSSQDAYKNNVSKLEDRIYWVIYFVGLPKNGGGIAKDNSVTVILDKNTGELLLLEEGG